MAIYSGRKTKICVVTTNRSDYGRMKLVMQEIQKDSRLELQVVAGTHLFFDHLWWYFKHGEPTSWIRSLPWYLKARQMSFFGKEREIERKEQLMKLLVADGFPIHARIPMFLEGGNPRVMTKTIGLCLVGMPDVFARLRPDIVLINGDRFEMLPVAFATVSSNIFLAHIEGGDVSGTLDESTRHAITKLAHIHFPATEKSAARIRAMGEPPERIFVTGSPVIDVLTTFDLSLDNSLYAQYGQGGERVDLTQPFLLILQHPVTTRYEQNKAEMEELISAIDHMPIQKLFLAPNIDAGSDGVAEAIRHYRLRSPPRTAFFKYFHLHDFYRIFSHAAVVVGNSSSFIRESAFLGVPAVVVGDRQQGRERGGNVVEVLPVQNEIRAAIAHQIAHGRYPQNLLFGDGRASTKIVETLARFHQNDVPHQKKFYD